MKKTYFTRRNIWILTFVLMAIAFGAYLRILETPANFAPIGAIALFAGAYVLNRKLALVLPLAIMFISDLILHFGFPGWGFHSTMPFVYASFLLITLIGFKVRNNKSVVNIAGASLSSSLLFFIVTNFGVWITSGYYPLTFSGFLTCYSLAVPFIQNTVVSDLMFNALFFGSFYLLDARYPAIKKAE